MFPSKRAWGRGLRSVEEEYKANKIKSAFKLYKNTDPTMNLLRRFEERSGALGHNSLIKEATHFSSSLGLELNLNYPTPSCCTEEGEVVEYSKIKQKLRGAQQEKLKEKVAGQNWQGKLACTSFTSSCSLHEFITARRQERGRRLRSCADCGARRRNPLGISSRDVLRLRKASTCSVITRC